MILGSLGILGNIYIEGELVTRETIVDAFNAVAYSAYSSSGDGTVTAGVTSINGEQGDVTLKTVNGYSLLGEGDITIEGGTSCCTEMLENQAIIISMLESLTTDHNRINTLLDEINNEELTCEYEEVTLADDIIGEEISC